VLTGGCLAGTKSDHDPQSIAMRLAFWRRLERPAKEWEPLDKRIRARQKRDGGRSQSNEMASDAWATRKALFDPLGSQG